jgi:hypothetical protein
MSDRDILKLMLFLLIMYDKMYDKVSDILKELNPCEISKDSCIKDIAWCCNHCRYVTNIGCSVRSLVCRLWLCCKLRDTDKGKEFIERTFIIEETAWHFGFLNYTRYSKEDVFNDLLNIKRVNRE